MQWQTRVVAVLVGIMGLVACAVADNNTTLKSPEPPASPSPSDNIPTVVMGYCHPIPNGASAELGENMLTPNVQAKEFLNNEEHHAIDGTTNTSILLMPKHGSLHKVTVADKGRYYSETASLDSTVSYYMYLPEEGYTGNDNATILVDFGSVKVKLIYFFKVNDENMISECDDSCKKGEWEISSTLHSNNAFKTLQRISAVVIKNYTFPGGNTNKATTFHPGTTLMSDRISDDGKLHIEFSTPESFSGGDAWIPRDYVATKDQFTRVNSWNGVSSAKYEGIDDGADFNIHKDGSIDSTYGDRCGEVSQKGHLYRFKNILWMRLGQNDDLSSTNMFLSLPNGDMCNLAWPCPTGN